MKLSVHLKKIWNRLGKTGKSIVLISLSVAIILKFFLLVPMPVNAINATKDNPVLFTVRGSVIGGQVRYNIVVGEIFNQTYQSWTITYPSELEIQNTSALSSVWNISHTNETSKSANFIIKTGDRSAANLKIDMETIYFTLANSDVFPPDNSKISITAHPTKITFFQDSNGYAHWYEFIPFSGSTMTWMQAYNAAKAKTMQDPRYPTDPSKQLHGYLAVITSEEEQMQIYSAIAKECGWLGGTRMVKTGGAKIQDDTSIATAIGSFDTGTTLGNVWYWACGPEAWTTYNGSSYEYKSVGTPGATPLVFFNRPTHAISPSVNGGPIGTYHNFNNPFGFDHFFNTNGTYVGRNAATGAEPNNSNTEYCLQFAYTSGNKTYGPVPDPDTGISTSYTNTRPDTWNDFSLNPGTAVTGYYVEYGGYADDPHTNELGGADVTTSSEVELVLPIVVQYRSTEKTGDVYRQITSIGGTYDRMQNYEQFLPYTAKRNEDGLPGSIFGYIPYGYEFVGQQSDKDNLTVNASGDVSGFFSKFSQRIIFLYKPVTLTVNFNANFSGWTNSDVTTTSKTVSYDSPYGTLPIATRPGYTFLGWYTEQTAGTLVTDTTPLVNTTNNHTLYAHWDSKTGYTVKYDLNGGTSSPIPDKTGVNWTGTGLTPAISPTKTGYIFTGWNVSVNGSKQNVTNSDTYSSLAFSDVDTFVTLQAQWIPEPPDTTCTIIYDTNGSTSPTFVSNATVSDDSQIVPMPTLVRTGYTFSGWYVVNNGSGSSNGTLYTSADGKIFYNLSAPSASFIVLEAQWTPKTYVVNYDINDGASSPGTSRTGVLWNQSGLVPAPDGTPTRTHYLFMGWNTEPNGAGRNVYVGDSYSVLVNGNDEVSNITLYAQWAEEVSYFVQYDMNGAQDPTSIPNKTDVYMEDDDLIPTDTITPPVGFDFAGWAVIFNGTKQGVTSTDKFEDLADNPNAGYIILQAQWSPKSGLTVNYNANGGSWASPPSNKTDVVWSQSHLTPLVEPTRSNYIFVGWKTGGGILADNSSTFGNLVDNNDTLTSVTLYAQWAHETEYTVRYNVNGGQETIPNEILYDRSEIIPAPTPIAPVGYVFTHWSVEDNGYGQGTSSSPDGTTTTFDSLAYLGMNYIVLRANYSVKNTYKVYYDFNYDGAPAPGVINDVAWTNINLVPYSAMQPGFSLLGWSTEPTGGTTALPASSYGTLAGGIDVSSITLYAQWAPASFYVRYDLGGASIPSGSTDYDQRTIGFDDIGLVPPPLSRDGYRLVQWNVSENGFKSNVQAGDTFRTLSNTGVQYITLQAQWEAKDYEILYDTNGGTPSTLSPQTGVRWWSPVEIPEAPTPPSGYHFTGWKLSTVGITPVENIAAGPVLTDGLTRFSDLAVTDSVTTTSVTIQAQYDEDNPVDITYSAINGTVDTDFQSIGPATGTPSSTATANPGYHFDGWYTLSDTTFSTKLSSSVTFTPAKVGGLNVAGSYVARFLEDSTVTINYSAINGSVTSPSESVAPATGTPDGSTASANPGYHLDGWYALSDTTFTTKLSSSLTFTPVQDENNLNVSGSYVARFVEDSNITINYSAIDGTVTLPSESVAPATGTATGSTASANPGYHFDGWYALSDTTFSTKLSGSLAFAPAKSGGLNLAGSYVARFLEDDNVTINYSAINGSVSSSIENVAPATGAASGSTATANHGYHFDGWYALPDVTFADKLSSELSFTPSRAGAGSGLNVKGSYVARFLEDDNVTINYSATNGTVSSDSESVAPATGTSSGSTASADAGYHLDGWYAVSDTTFSVKLADTLAFTPAKNSNNLNVAGSYVARFLEDSDVTINYSAIDGTVTRDTEDVPPATGTAQGSTAAANPGYHFDGWYALSDTTFATKVSSSLDFTPSKSGGLNLSGSYVARFLEDDNVTINYSAIDGNVTSPSESVAPDTGTASGSTASANPGYHLDGWYASNDTEFASKLSSELSFTPARVGTGTGLNVAGSYIARFLEDDDVTINYSAIDGTVSRDTEDVPPATGTAQGSTAAANPGYHFDGWYKASDAEFADKLSNELTFVPGKNGDNLNVAGDYIARFIEDPDITITYAPLPGGSINRNDETIAPATGTPQGSTATPSDGYHFVGWYAADDVGFENKLSSNLTFSPAKDSNGLNPEADYVAKFVKYWNIIYKNFDGTDLTINDPSYPMTYDESDVTDLTLLNAPEGWMKGYDLYGFYDCPLDKSIKVPIGGVEYEGEKSLDFNIGNKITEISSASTGDRVLYLRPWSNMVDEYINDKDNYLWAPFGVFPNGSTVSIRVTEPGTAKYNRLVKEVDQRGKVKIVEFEVFDEDGMKIQPNSFFGDVVLGFRVPEGFDVKDIAVWRVIMGGQDIQLRDRIWVDPNDRSQWYIEGFTDHLSPYAIVTPEDISENEDGLWNLLPTGDEAQRRQILMLQLVAILSLGALGGTIFIKKRKPRDSGNQPKN